MAKTYFMKNQKAILVSQVNNMTEAGMSVTEISERLGLPESTVRSYKNKIARWQKDSTKEGLN